MPEGLRFLHKQGNHLESAENVLYSQCLYSGRIIFIDRGANRMFQVAIVEDEQAYISQLTHYIEKYRRAHGTDISVSVFHDGDEILENYNGRFDIILMDIQMRFMDGMTAAEEIRKVDQKVIIIFITNMEQYAVRGYQVDALDYIVKPVEYYSFSRKLDRAISRIRRHGSSFITIHAGGGIYKIPASQIIYIESEGHNLHFFTTGGEYISRMNISDAEKELVHCGFYRCGKGYIVNLDKVDSYVDGICRLGSHSIPVSRAKKKEFLSVMTDYMSSRLL